MMYGKITELDKKSQGLQITTMKYCMGMKSEAIIKTMNLTAEEQNNFHAMILKFESYFNPKINEIGLRRAFQNRRLEQGKNIDLYRRSLYATANISNFSDKNERIRDQFISGFKYKMP